LGRAEDASHIGLGAADGKTGSRGIIKKLMIQGRRGLFAEAQQQLKY
jgi:hypothetical protein